MRLPAVLLTLLVAGCGGPAATRADAPAPTTATPVQLPATAPRVTIAPTPTCSTAKEPFVPTSIDLTGLALPVLALGRDERNVPGVPSLADKFVVAWDAPGIQPGADKGNVLLNTHTWPDGSALGNRLLAKLQEGDRFVLENDGLRLCYRVTERTEVSVENPPLKRVYDREGPPQAVMIVCSGTRLGPGNWTHRTLWFAEPVS
ncbi:MAG TPA: sortase [Nocardioidaceae bacterium]|nr:sortase [Nocardioidaceae bacterium]